VTIPVLAPPASGVLSRAYVTPAMFRGFPTWLDTDNLLPGGTAAVQTDILADVLLTASDWAVGVCENMLLHAHWVQNENQRTRASGNGRIYLRPHDIPLRAVTALSYGWDPSAMTSLSLPAPGMWIEDGREVSFTPNAGLNFTGPAIQFGPAARPGTEVYVQWSYIPGYPFALLPSGVSAAATSVTVDDPTGILPGDVLRIYDPGLSEALTVASTYVPAMPTWPPTATSIPLAAAVQNSHAAGTGITGFPRKALQGIIAYGVALLMREDVSGEEPVSGFGPEARSTAAGRGGAAAGIVNDAYEWLAPYRPVLRS
jgi:hypothetical protein